MKIDIIKHDRWAYAPAELMSSNLAPNRFALTFLIDTGCYTTTIGHLDAQNLGIDFSKLKKSDIPARGVGGTEDTYILKDVWLKFTTDSSTPLFIYLEEIDVFRYVDDGNIVDSLLGTDVLQRLKYTYGKDITLEVDESSLKKKNK